MPYFPELKILFIHIPKNAGGSVERALSDVDAHFRVRGPDRYRRFSCRIIRKLVRFGNQRVSEGQYFYGRELIPVTLEHLTFDEIMSMRFLNPIDIKNTRVMYVVRNPFTRLVSLFHSHNRKDKYSSFSDFVSKWLLQDRLCLHDEWSHRKRQSEFVEGLSEANPFEVTCLRFEDFQESFQSWLYAATARKAEVPHAHRSNRKCKRWEEFYRDQGVIREVYNYYQDDFINFNYDPKIN